MQLDKTGRQPPTRYAPEQVREILDRVEASLEVPTAKWVKAAQKTLRAIRSGAAERFAMVDDVQLLERITDDGERAYYHLTQRARELLRRGNGLPWGA